MSEEWHDDKLMNYISLIKLQGEMSSGATSHTAKAMYLMSEATV